MPEQRAIYLGCLLATAVATALFVAPTAQHRLGFRMLDKEWLLIRSNRQIIAGLVLVSAAISLAIFLVVWVVLDSSWAAVIATSIATWFATCWFFPHFRRRHVDEEDRR